MGGLRGWGRAAEVDTPARRTARPNAHPAERTRKGAGRGACAGHGALLRSCLSATGGRGQGLAVGALLWLTLATRMRVPLAKPTLHTVVLGVPSRRCDLMAESARDPCGRAPDRGLRRSAS